jgi:hypothetical protein
MSAITEIVPVARKKCQPAGICDQSRRPAKRPQRRQIEQSDALRDSDVVLRLADGTARLKVTGFVYRCGFQPFGK